MNSVAPRLTIFRTAAAVVLLVNAASLAQAANVLTAFYDPTTGVIEL